MSYDELKKLSDKELTTELREIDLEMKKKHRQYTYIATPWFDGSIIKEKNLSEEKKEEIQAQINRAVAWDIICLCIEGIYAYNKKENLDYADPLKLYNDILMKFDEYCKTPNIPKDMQEYYEFVLRDKNFCYINDYISDEKYMKYINGNQGNGNNKSKVFTKSTAAGKAMADSDAAFASILLLPALLTLIYILAVVVYFIFIK